MKGFKNGRFQNYILYVVASCSFLFSGFFTNSTIYGSANVSTPYIDGGLNLENDYRYNFGIRKIALFPYQSRSKFYKGNEESLSDKAIFGAVNGVEYLFSASSVRNRGYEYLDQEYWLKWSNSHFITKTKYLNKESRDLEFASFDNRYKLELGPVALSMGGIFKGHPIYGHPAIEDYNGYWWDLAYEYGYQDYLVPINDLNDNGEIDNYYIWIETNPDTEEGYWEYYYEGADYYWEDSDSSAVAYSDSEFLQYHYPNVVHMYNADNKEKSWQAEFALVIGLDFYMSGDKYHSHLWVNTFPYSVGLTDKSYNGDDIQYDVGLLVGTNLSEHIGVFIEGSYLSYYGKEEYNIGTGVNWRF